MSLFGMFITSIKEHWSKNHLLYFTVSSQIQKRFFLSFFAFFLKAMYTICNKVKSF